MAEDKGHVRATPIDAPAAPVSEPKDAQWHEVRIRLTDEQVSSLRELGVDTNELVIHTFDISRLGSAVPN